MTTGFYEKYILPKRNPPIHLETNGKISCNMKYKWGIKTTIDKDKVTCRNCKRTYIFTPIKK